MAKHRKQHFVAQSYLRAWCDPETPAHQDAYVWRFSKDGTNGRRKAPENIFHETDLYTIIAPDGGRDLRLEHGLAQLEDEFVKLRDSKLARQEPLEPREHALLCAFVAATHVRTPTQRDHLAGIWGQALVQADHMMEWARTATSAQRLAAADLPPRSKRERENSFSYEEVQALAQKPMQNTLGPMVRAEAGQLAQLDLLILTANEHTFITSDNPCVWFDSEACKRPPMYQGVGLRYPSIQITLAGSPRQMLLLVHGRGVIGYGAMPGPMVDEMNRRTRAYCSEYFVTNTNATRPIWFDLGEEPKDSWQKLHRDDDTKREQQ